MSNVIDIGALAAQRLTAQAGYGPKNLVGSDPSFVCDCRIGAFFSTVLTGNRVIAPINQQSGQQILVELVQDGSGNHTVTWPTGTLWNGGTIPTLTTAGGGIDLFVLVWDDLREVWLGHIFGQAMDV